ncbi:hypothetical protein HER32_00955 [Hymenobacter sp. BT18]|uniref:methionyl-tRNA formyltransferase n=1 Tax=Hymenobacter sp. BT18 TaxID=2835648 RepID=UPI00143E8A74|nr:formyltransferase family protein [Hymenobacter sp. BT18]QIX59832.1 hypothetical protein HER32_00955 [Hymenobacter sp. BT18]
MRIAVILGSVLGLAAVQELATCGAVCSVAVPSTEHPEPDELAAQLLGAGWPVVRLGRPGLGNALLAWLDACQPDVVLVFTFPWRVPARVLVAGPRLGFLNFHFAALPGYRGPEPIFWQIRHGEAAGAVTVHRMEAAFDTGPVLLAQAVPIAAHDTHGLHRARLAVAAAGVARQLLAAWQGETAPLVEIPQNPALARYWPRAGLADVCLRWAEPAQALERLVRAANPWNRGAITTLRGQLLRVLGATALAQLPKPLQAPPGTVVLATGPEGLVVACGQNSGLRLDIVGLDEGYFTGGQLAALGLQAGEQLPEYLSAPIASAG